MIETFGKGAIPDLPDDRDLLAAPHLGALPPIDWTKEFRLPDPGDEDQGSSDSCVAQSSSYYHFQIDPANYSRRDLYCRIFQPDGGAYLRDGMTQIVSVGQDTRDHMPDPQPETETGMRDKTGLNPKLENAHQELSYKAITAVTPEAIAQSVLNFKGAIFGVSGSDEGWQDLMNPRPPQSDETVWGHALYAMGYHTHQDGQKCIIAKSSWCNEVKEHHIRANYFSGGNVFSPWTLIPKEQNMTTKFLVNQNGKVGIMILEGFTGSIFFADSMAHLQELKDAFGIPATAPTITIPS